jgi:protein O-mannosyl-transferase
MGPLVVLVAVLLVYMQSLGGALVWDDRFLILGAPLVEQGASLDTYLRAPFWTGAGGADQQVGYYRPLITLSFALDHRLHGQNAAGFHLTNVIVHVINAQLVLALLKKHGVRPLVAALLTIVWALLPRLAEAGAWVSGRTDLLASAFALAALLSFTATPRGGAVAALFFGVGLFAKESAIAVLPALFLSEWVRMRHDGSRLSKRRAIELALPFAAVLLAYAALRLRAIGYHDMSLRLGAVGRVLTVFEALGTYAAMLLDPFRPRAVIGRLGDISAGGVVAGVAVLIGVVVSLVRFGKRIGRVEALGLGLAFGAVLPVLHIAPLPVRALAADRYLYLPSLGLLLALAPVIDRLFGLRRPAFVGALALAITLGVVCSRRVGVWSDELEFWVQTYLQTPRNNNMAATELASVYYRASLFEDALTLYRRSMSYEDPSRRAPAYNVGLCLTRLGDRTAAREALERSQPKYRQDSDIEFHLAALELREDEAPRARERLERAARAGHSGAQWLLARFDSVLSAREELAALALDAKPVQRARFLTLLGEDVPANALWARAQAEPGVSQSISLEALVQLTRTGHRAALLDAHQRHTERFGAVPAALAESIAVRVEELDRLMAARTRLSLPVPASERTAVR